MYNSKITAYRNLNVKLFDPHILMRSYCWTLL